MLNILFIGDINGKIGREAVKKILPKLKREEKIDLVIANAENAAHGSGVTEESLKELQSAGIDYFTNGDHAFDRIKQAEICYEKFPIIRPANFPPDVPGQGYTLINTKQGDILLINLIGRVFMQPDLDCPFRKFQEILANFENQKLFAIIIDIHAEATSEKISFGHFADGRATAVLGTHTHIMTADEKITGKGMAYITDVGMVGAADECIGVSKEGIIKTYLTQIKYPHVIPESGKAIFGSVLLKIDEKTGKANSIKSIVKFINIK
ncbi:MAG: TIGR00282 family metallophosphoesterase [Patescibacteria group bacterium]|nr:TIGR00282 family metallophosphoesterase [Patescibacteria group bacterium]MDD4610581.1 TIGR00282 family metallophosphoesterase [Patescibacteria group bacterium]